MIEGAETAEAASLAVIAFASEFPTYGENAVEALESYWGETGTDALVEAVEGLAAVESYEEAVAAQEALDQHIAHRAEVLGGLSDEIARRDGEDVRQVTAQLAQHDDELAWQDDVEATARLLGHRNVAKAGKASVVKEGFLREFDAEVERAGFAGGCTPTRRSSGTGEPRPRPTHS